MKARLTMLVAAMFLGLASFAYSQGVGSDVNKAADKDRGCDKDAAKTRLTPPRRQPRRRACHRPSG